MSSISIPERDEDTLYDDYRQRKVDAADEELMRKENELLQQQDYPPQGDQVE